MIPVRLELTNFLSYRETAVLDFKDIHLAGIAGQNGAGKSSIMEAMTWAVFGRSRVRSDDDLVNRQAEDGEAAVVRFTFELEGVTYRILRQKSPGKTLILELQMDAGDGSWKPLSESKIRETQAAIEALLRMNYDTFVNASFLLQGKADQFTTRTPSQRKEILAELLGVTEWDRYRERASSARKELEGMIAILDARLDEYRSELAEEPERRQALQVAEEQRRLVNERRDLKELLLNEVRLKEETRKQLSQSIAAAVERMQRLQKSLEQAEITLANRRERKDLLAQTIGNEAEITAVYATWQEVDRQAARHQEKANRYNELLQAMQPLELEIAQAHSRLEQHQKALHEQEAMVAVANGEKSKLLTEIDETDQQFSAVKEELERLAQVDKQLGEARATLQQTKGERNLWHRELERLEAQSKRMDQLSQEKRNAQKARDEGTELVTILDEQISVIEDQQEAYTQLQAELKALEGQQPTLKKEMNLLKTRIDDLSAAEAGGPCPLCDQPLSEEHRQTVLDTLNADGKHYGDTFRENEARLKALAVELPQVKKTMEKGPALVRDRQAQQQRLAKIEARLEEIQRAESEWRDDGEQRLVDLSALLADRSRLEELTERVKNHEEALSGRPALQTQLQALQNTLATAKARLSENERLIDDWQEKGQQTLADVEKSLRSDDYAQDARRELADLQEKMANLDYDADAHRGAVKEREAMAGAPQQFQVLNEAKAAFGPLQESIADLERQINEQTADRQSQQRLLDESRAQLAALNSEPSDLRALEKEVFDLREEAIAAAEKVGKARQHLEVLDTLRQSQSEYLEERDSLLLRVQQLAMLEKSCGREGVQALLIEHALPEIEDGANELLERLTGGAMRIKFDTQRQLKSRDALAETLDIVISDQAGERPYDNYSGGEQFRINFAIRLALSQLLAKRAGARLRTLVIDEGFGSQDPEGRQRLIEAINAIQNDFACVLVITHIDELREVFPTRIEVQKGLDGSQISVY